MPVIIAGQSGATWGLGNQSGFIAQTGETESTVEENSSKNADGEVEMTSFYNPTRSVEIGGVFLGIAQSLGQVMSAAAILLIGSPSGSIYCKSVRISQSNDGFAMFHMRGTQYNLF